MKYERAAREFLKSRITNVSEADFLTFAQAYGSDRTKAPNAPTKARLMKTLKRVQSELATSQALVVPTLGRGSFTRSGRVSSRKPGKLTPCR